MKTANRSIEAPNKLLQPDPVGFFETVSRTFEAVVKQTGAAIDKFYSLHGHLIRLRFANTALIPRITPALEHWAVDPQDDPELTIQLWDDASTGTTMPPPPWPKHEYYVYTRRGEVRGYNSDRIRTAFHLGSDTLCMADMAQGQAIYWTPNGEALPQWETGSPLRTILHWWLRQYRLQFVHAGAVGTPEGGVLIVGKGGSGKSTTALTCLDSELMYVSDDYCLVSIQPEPYAHNLYNSGKVAADNLYRVPHLKPIISNSDRLDREKALFFLNKTWSEKLSIGFPIKAILVPRITNGVDTSLSSASKTAALSALTLSTMLQLAGAGPAMLQILKQLVNQVPCYYLELGADLSQIPNTILDLLSCNINK